MHVISTATPALRAEIEGPVASVLIDNPARRNALDLAMWSAIPPLFERLESEPGVRVIVLRGAGELAFASGADISEFETVRSTAEGGKAYEAANEAAFRAIAQCALPVIAMIRGFCLGGGLGLAVSCDLRVAAEGAVFGIPAARLGVGYPPAAMAYVVAALGPMAAKDLFYTGRRIDTAEAARLGLLARVLPRRNGSKRRRWLSPTRSPRTRPSPSGRRSAPSMPPPGCRARLSRPNSTHSSAHASTARTIARAARPSWRSALPGSRAADPLIELHDELTATYERTRSSPPGSRAG